MREDSRSPRLGFVLVIVGLYMSVPLMMVLFCLSGRWWSGMILALVRLVLSVVVALALFLMFTLRMYVIRDTTSGRRRRRER